MKSVEEIKKSIRELLSQKDHSDERDLFTIGPDGDEHPDDFRLAVEEMIRDGMLRGKVMDGLSSSASVRLTQRS